MKKIFYCSLFLIFAFTSCQTLYSYRLPSESEKKSLPPDSLRWGYTGLVITSIPVVNENGMIYRLSITPKTKIEIKTEEGLTYRFYIQSVKITGDDDLLGTTKTWSGYDLFNHAQVTVLAQEVSSIKILSDDKAATPIVIR